MGSRIKQIRRRLEYNQTEFGTLLDVVASAVSAYERGEKHPTYENIIKIAGLGCVTLDWLIAGKEELRKNTDNNVAGTIEPGNDQAKTRLIEAGQKATARNIHLRQIIEWMDDAFGKNEEQALFFYEDLKERYPSFYEFMERKRPARENDPVKKSQAS